MNYTVFNLYTVHSSYLFPPYELALHKTLASLRSISETILYEKVPSRLKQLEMNNSNRNDSNHH